MLADEQGAAPGFRMGAHDRMHRRPHFVDLGAGQVGAPPAALLQFGIFGEVTVFGAAPVDGAPQVAGQLVPGQVLVGEQGIASIERQLLRVEHRAQAGHRLVRQVRMPEMAGIAQAERLAAFLDVGNDQHFRLGGQLELAQHMDLQRAEAAAEGHLLRRRDVLVAKHQHTVLKVGVVDQGEIFPAQRNGQVEAANGRAQRSDVETGVEDGGHGGERVMIEHPAYRRAFGAATKHFNYANAAGGTLRSILPSHCFVRDQGGQLAFCTWADGLAFNRIAVCDDAPCAITWS